MPFRPAGVAIGYESVAAPLCTACGACMLMMPCNGSAAFTSLMAVGTKPCVSGISGTCSTPAIMSVKWLVSAQASCLS